MIVLSIDVTKLDRARFKEHKCKDGHTAKYCELVLIETPDSEYGDFMVKQGVTKEEREARVEMAILGNAKHVGGQKRTSAPPRRPAPPKQQDPDLDAPEECPF